MARQKRRKKATGLQVVPKVMTAVEVAKEVNARVSEILALAKKFDGIEKEQDKLELGKVKLAAQVGAMLNEWEASMPEDAWKDMVQKLEAKGFKSTRRNDWKRIGLYWKQIQGAEEFKAKRTIPVALQIGQNLHQEATADNPRTKKAVARKAAKQAEEARQAAAAKQAEEATPESSAGRESAAKAAEPSIPDAAGKQQAVVIEPEGEVVQPEVEGEGKLIEVTFLVSGYISESFFEAWTAGCYSIPATIPLFLNRKLAAKLVECEASQEAAV